MAAPGKVLIDSNGKAVRVKSFHGVNATAITSTTPVAIKAAVTSKRHFIARAQISQPTAETGVLNIEDNAGTPEVLAKFGFVNALQIAVEFDPPIEVAAGKAINGVSSGSVGDAFISIQGWVEE